VREATSGAHLPQSPQRPFAENLLTNDAFDWQLANWQNGKLAMANWRLAKWKLDFACLCSGAFSWKFMRSMAIRGFLASTASTSTRASVQCPVSSDQAFGTWSCWIFLVWQHGRRTKALNERGKSLFTASSVWPDYTLDCFGPAIVGDPLTAFLFSGNYEFRRFCFSSAEGRCVCICVVSCGDSHKLLNILKASTHNFA